MAIAIQGFDWDEANLKKLIKHKVTQDEAEEIFYIAPWIDQEAYERTEKRYRCLGLTSEKKYLAAFFTLRKNLIRNISVRPMSRRERNFYENKKR